MVLGTMETTLQLREDSLRKKLGPELNIMGLCLED